MFCQNPQDLRKKPGVYKISCLANERFYIGSSYDLYKRFKEHSNGLKSGKHANQHLQRAYNKYGAETFVFEIIELCEVSNFTQREQYYLDTLRPHDRFVGFNVSPSAYSPLGSKRSEECKKQLAFRRESQMTTKCLISPDNTPFFFKNVRKFAREHNLSHICVFDVLYGNSSFTGDGWRLPNTDLKGYSFLNPKKEKVFVRWGELRTFCKERQLNYNLMRLLASKKSTSYKGWTHGDREDLFVELIGPEGQREFVCKESYTWFYKEKGMSQGNFSSMMRGELGTSKGWRLSTTHNLLRDKIYKILSPSNEIIEIRYGEAKKIAPTLGLTYSQLTRLMYGLQSSSNGFKSLRYLEKNKLES